MRHVISVWMENEPGALSRVVGLFSQRGYNIESLSVAPTEDATLSRLTLTTVGDDRTIEQIIRHLERIVDVVQVQDLPGIHSIERELMLVKLQAHDGLREEIKRLSDIFRAQVIDVGNQAYVVQLVGDGPKLDAFLKAAGAENILEVVRSGVLGITRSRAGPQDS